MNKREFSAEERADRAFMRVARVIDELWEEDRGVHTRLLEWLIPDELVSVGTSTKGGGYREHLVPCVVIIDHCIVQFERGASLADAARSIRRLLKVASITREEARMVDSDLGLKMCMPVGWNPEDGDVYARLRLAGIELQQH